MAQQFVVDTSVLVELLRNSSSKAAVLETIISSYSPESLAITSIVEFEVLIGARDKRHFTLLRELLARFVCIPVTPEICTLVKDWLYLFALSHRPSLPDLLIGATAAVHNVPLLTLNTRDFDYLPGLTLVPLT